MMAKIGLLSGLLLLSFSACTQEKIEKGSKAPQMKCGAGKCGANMFDAMAKDSAMKCGVGKCGNASK